MYDNNKNKNWKWGRNLLSWELEKFHGVYNFVAYAKKKSEIVSFTQRVFTFIYLYISTKNVIMLIRKFIIHSKSSVAIFKEIKKLVERERQFFIIK